MWSTIDDLCESTFPLKAQSGRPDWAIVCFGQVFENYRLNPHFCATFFPQLGNFNKKWVGIRVARWYIFKPK
jgi:hypothetical protein